VPDRKVVWITTESIRKTDNFDWTGTKMIFELTPKEGGTQLNYTYDGLVLENETDRLAQICDMTIKEMLYNFITNGKGNRFSMDKSYTASIEVAKSPSEVFRCITIDVAKWWGGKDLTGHSAKLNDEFVIHHPGSHYSKQRVVEFVPGGGYNTRLLSKLVGPMGKVYSIELTSFPDRMKDAIKPVIIPSHDIGQQKPMFFKSEKAKLSPADDFAMRDVVRATTAAPTFFTPTKVQPADGSSSYGLVDGGIDAGNPALCAYAEAIKTKVDAAAKLQLIQQQMENLNSRISGISDSQQNPQPAITTPQPSHINPIIPHPDTDKAQPKAAALGLTHKVIVNGQVVGYSKEDKSDYHSVKSLIGDGN